MNPFRYRSYYFDEGTGLYYLNSRYYDPETGRFINSDDISNLDSDSINGLNLYTYCANNPIMYIDVDGFAPRWWQWLINGLSTVVGIVLCFVPGAQALGADLIISGVSGLIANTMDAAGVNGKIAMQIQSVLNIIGGVCLSFVPGLGALGASMIGAGVLSFAVGYISEALGGGYALGWEIGNIAGSIVGGLIYKGIVNKISTPERMMKSLQNHPNRWKIVGQEVSDATGKKYIGGVSTYTNYINKWTKAHLGTHQIIRNGMYIHGPHYRKWF